MSCVLDAGRRELRHNTKPFRPAFIKDPTITIIYVVCVIWAIIQTIQSLLEVRIGKYTYMRDEKTLRCGIVITYEWRDGHDRGGVHYGLPAGGQGVD